MALSYFIEHSKPTITTLTGFTTDMECPMLHVEDSNGNGLFSSEHTDVHGFGILINGSGLLHLKLLDLFANLLYT